MVVVDNEDRRQSANKARSRFAHRSEEQQPSFSFPDALWTVEDLCKLQVKSSGLTMIPLQVGKLVNLRALYLEGNAICDVPEEIALCCELTELSLQCNNLSVFPIHILGLTHLKRLDLRYKYFLLRGFVFVSFLFFSFSYSLP